MRSLFGEISNHVKETNNEIETPDFYLDMDVLDCLCHYIYLNFKLMS
jgi:hypothetical protein